MRNQKIAQLLHQYFELGVAEGREGRSHDTEAGDAQRVLSEIEAEIAALSAAEPEKPATEEYGHPEWIWYCECQTGPMVTLGRWAKDPRQKRYKLADIQPTEHDHPAPSVAVKALEWNPYRAETPFGWYQIDDQRSVPESELKGRPPFLLCGSRLDYLRHPTLEDARAAAQADYEARIRSALSAQVQDVATAAEFADRMFKLHGFMLSEEYRGNPAVTITFPDNEERNLFYSAIVELSTHKTPAAPAKQEG